MSGLCVEPDPSEANALLCSLLFEGKQDQSGVPRRKSDRMERLGVERLGRVGVQAKEVIVGPPHCHTRLNLI